MHITITGMIKICLPAAMLKIISIWIHHDTNSGKAALSETAVPKKHLTEAKTFLSDDAIL